MISEQAALAAAKAIAQAEGYSWEDTTARAEWRATLLDQPCWAVRTADPELHWTEQELDDFGVILLIDAETGSFLGMDRGPRGIVLVKSASPPKL